MFSQAPAFYHLSTAEGLSDNNVNSAARDQNGILWIGTTEGLNSFDGNRITTYHKYKYPVLGDNYVDKVLVDSENEVWIRTGAQNLLLLDRRRIFRSLKFETPDTSKGLLSIFHTKSRGVIALRGYHHFWRKDKNSYSLIPLPFPEDSLIPSRTRLIFRVDEDRLGFVNNGRLIIVDYSLMKVTLDMRFPRLMSAAPISNDELLAYPPEGDVFYRISISGQKVIREYRNLHDQYGKPIAANLRYIASMGNEYFAITSRFSGMYFLNLRDEKLYHWPHDPLDQSSIGGNNPYWVSYDTSGYLMITSQTSGLHYLNVKQKQAYSKPYFLDAKGEVFDGFIQSVVTGKDGTVWMGAQDRLISWNRLTNETVYVPCFLPNGINISKEETIRALDFEVSGDLWVGTSRYGVLVIDKNLRTIRHFSDSMPRGLEGLPSNWINEMTTDKDGNEWIGTLKGTCMIEKRSNQVISFSDHPVLSPVSKIPCNTLWKDRNGRMWIGTTKGAWCFDAFNNSLKHFSTDNGLPQNNVLAINEDDLGNTYIGTPGGLTIITSSGSTRTYNRSNGMRNDRCEGILKDDNGFIWIGNLNCITRYDPRSQKFAVYEEGYGFSHAGFRMRSCHKSASGEMFWGTDKGLTWFYPGDMNSISLPLHPVISALQTADTMYRFTKGESLRFPYNSSSFAFYFSSGELAGGKKIQYLYRLKAFDNNWKTPATLGNVTYSKLPPGEYQFEIRSSYDGLNWFSGAYPITLVIGKPWWQQTWFRILCLLGMALVVYGTIRYFRKRKRERELDGLIDYFTKSGYEHSGVDDILWDISRNCISRMGFTDCVIYLVDRQKNTLVQKAAYGPKNLNAFEITNPIEIPMGKGIVGSVAASGHPVVIGDTSKDDRYIVDDERRLSEISVPIIHDNRVIGVIDSEHPRRNFFNRRQLKTLETIASICSAKISRAMAMDAMKKSQLELMELNVKMAESKFLNLRLQMNPHFLFNSLSSIQHLIVSQQTTRAYKYLTVFSNFLRSLLNHADQNFTALDEELRILNMYVELESLRFDQSFSYSITMDEQLSGEMVLVPSLMVQPFAENAIWHGLLHKEGDKKLSIRFSGAAEDYLTCIIEDNGVGRTKSATVQQMKLSSKVHESKGINIIRERLELLQKKTGKPAKVEITDLYNPQNEPSGTRVTITIPYYNPEMS